MLFFRKRTPAKILSVSYMRGLPQLLWAYSDPRLASVLHTKFGATRLRNAETYMFMYSKMPPSAMLDFKKSGILGRTGPRRANT